MASYDVIVIGAGIEGSASAYTLAKQNQRVLLVEQFPLPHSRGSSGGHSRIIRYSYHDSFYVHMMKDCFPFWDQLEKESNSNLYVPCGYLDLMPPGSAGQAKMLENLRAHNVSHEVLGPLEVRQRFPMVSPGEGAGAIWDPAGGVLRADKCLAAYRKMILQYGGEIRDAEPVTSLIPGDLVSVMTSRGIYKAPKVVIAAGPWADTFTESLGLNLPLKTIRVNVLYWSSLPGKEHVHSSNNMPVVSRFEENSLKVYSLPIDEYPGLVKVCLHTGPDSDPNSRDRVNSQWVKDEMSAAVKELFPWLRSDKPAIEETCMYTLTPDCHPFIDVHPIHSNIVIAAGFSGHGFKLAPAVGKAVSELVLGQTPSYDMTPFKLDRFSPKAKL